MVGFASHSCARLRVARHCARCISGTFSGVHLIAVACVVLSVLEQPSFKWVACFLGEGLVRLGNSEGWSCGASRCCHLCAACALLAWTCRRLLVLSGTTLVPAISSLCSSACAHQVVGICAMRVVPRCEGGPATASSRGQAWRVPHSFVGASMRCVFGRPLRRCAYLTNWTQPAFIGPMVLEPPT